MDNQWRTDEPEVGQVCRLIDLAYPGVWTKNAGEKGFFFHPEKYVRLSADVWPWLPITTPEERRLRAEVGRLREAIRRHKEKVKTIGEEYKVPKADAELWATIEPEAGGAG